MTRFQLTELRTSADARGSLSVAQTGGQLPFAAERVFIVHGVPDGDVRGRHAHKACHQFLVAVAGAVDVMLDDGAERATFRLDSPSLGLHIPPGTWGEQTYLGGDAVLMVLASHPYDTADYISDYQEFLAFRKGPA